MGNHLKQRKKLLIICGPTATGKTALGINLAKKFGGEIVSADSRQVYKGMDIGTGKDIENEKLKIKSEKLQSKIKKEINERFNIGVYEIGNIPVWLLDIVSPDYRFSVADYVECANLVIKDIWKRKKLPILVGGTGFYIKAVIDGIETLGVKPDWELRKQLSKLAIEQLRKRLKDLDPERSRRMNESDRSNPRRLIRAIEIARSETSTPNVLMYRYIKTSDILLIGLKIPYKFLYQRIDKRVEERIKSGVEKEIRKLLNKGYNFENSVLRTTIGYQEWEPYYPNLKCKIENLKLKEEIIKRWKFDEHGYARRQMTWFRKALRQAQGEKRRGYWFDIMDCDYQLKIEKLVKDWYYNN